jgi:hypothetical protein
MTLRVLEKEEEEEEEAMATALCLLCDHHHMDLVRFLPPREFGCRRTCCAAPAVTVRLCSARLRHNMIHDHAGTPLLSTIGVCSIHPYYAFQRTPAAIAAHSYPRGALPHISWNLLMRFADASHALSFAMLCSALHNVCGDRHRVLTSRVM